MRNYKYKIGQAVRVKKDLDTAGWREYWMRSGPGEGRAFAFTFLSMNKFKGKVVHISEYTSSSRYRIKEDSECIWTDDMFEGPSQPFICKNLL